MLISDFFGWAERASAGERADAVGALAKSFLYADLDPAEFGEAELALTAMLDDPSPLVRRALAEALASAVDAPPHILRALLGDSPDIAALVLERSPALSEADLVDSVAIGDDALQSVIARRPVVSAAVAGALAELGGRRAAVALAGNAGACLGDFAFRRLVERFGRDGEVREALRGRPDVPAAIRHALAAAAAETLSAFAVGCGWLGAARARRVADDARDRATMTIGAALTEAADVVRFAHHLHDAGYMTPALLVRALLSHNPRLFEAGLAVLSGRGSESVAGLVRNADGLAFAALFTSTGLPPALLPIVRALLRTPSSTGHHDVPAQLDRAAIARVLAGYDAERPGAVADDRPLALLRRFEAEAVRDQARLARAERAAARIDAIALAAVAAALPAAA